MKFWAPKATVLVQLTVDEAVKLRPEWKNFLADHDKRHSQEFSKTLERLRKLIR